MKKYTLEIIEENGKVNTSSSCEGFDALQLMGLLYIKLNDISNQVISSYQFLFDRTVNVKCECGKNHLMEIRSRTNSKEVGDEISEI